MYITAGMCMSAHQSFERAWYPQDEREDSLSGLFLTGEKIAMQI